MGCLHRPAAKLMQFFYFADVVIVACRRPRPFETRHENYHAGNWRKGGEAAIANFFMALAHSRANK